MDPLRSGSSTLTLYIVQPAVTVTYMSTTNLAEPPESNNGLMESTFALIDKLEKAETGEPVSQLTVTSATQPHMGNSQPHAGTHSHTCRQLTATHTHTVISKHHTQLTGGQLTATHAGNSQPGTVGWSDIALFAIFKKLHVSADQVYF